MPENILYLFWHGDHGYLPIGAGIRWLSFKFTKPKTGEKKNLVNMLRGYYDWNLGEAYAKKVFNLYNLSLANRLK